ncbi:GDP-mannose 4,6-dehydratase [Natrinema sp. CBA1119]|uniref:GDP-mannose 4,6-dehydratase n=1 Tax=Natrinema sp. CBA1119 TaxID=1608465 RepID=UPI0020D28B19|nr:GDP-mannose 4,6-dehydratase [Natrinema sp. CBA1119]
MAARIPRNGTEVCRLQSSSNGKESIETTAMYQFSPSYVVIENAEIKPRLAVLRSRTKRGLKRSTGWPRQSLEKEREDHPNEPVSPYGVSKLSGEHYTRVYNEVYGLSTVALRYFTVYGPRMRPNMAISNFVSRCMRGKLPQVYGDGEQTRDFTYIADVVDANRTLISDDSADGEVMNIGSTDNIDIATLAKVVRDEIDPSLNIEYTTAREGDAEHTHADISKANSLISYEPSRDIREDVREFIEWYEDNRDWYEPLVVNS